MKAKRAKRRKLTPEEKLERARAKTTAAMVEAAPSVEAAGIAQVIDRIRWERGPRAAAADWGIAP